MQVDKKNLSDTKVRLTLLADDEQLQAVKKKTLEQLARTMRIAGFREGKAPLSLVEKNVNHTTLQTEFLDRAVNLLYVGALREHNLRPVAQPNVSIAKFVPFTTLEVNMEVEVVGKISLPDYKKIQLAKKPVSITEKDINDVLDQLKKRYADKKDVSRAAKNGDQAVIDFKGVDAKTEEPISGAEGKEYSLLLGSNTFIPGFETNLIGLKSGEEKTFALTFPKDYGTKTLQNRKVTFKVTVNKVQEMVESEVNDAFAAKVGPLKTVADLKADIKKQLMTEKEYQADREYTDELLTSITRQATAAIPTVLVDEQIQRLIDEQRQNVVYRGATWQEFLEGQGVTEEQYREQIRENAELRVKGGLVLGEIAERENISVTPEEIDTRMKVLKAQYTDAQMQAELDKPEARKEIASRMVSEKTADKLVAYASNE